MDDTSKTFFYLIGFLLTIGLTIYCAVKHLFVLKWWVIIILCLVGLYIPGSPTILFIILKLMGKISCGWKMIIIPIILTMLEGDTVFEHMCY